MFQNECWHKTVWLQLQPVTGKLFTKGGYTLRGALLLAQTRLVRSGQTNTQDTKLVKNLEKLWNITVPFLYWGH